MWNGQLIRMEASDEGIVGVLKYNGALICWTLEHPELLIPTGVYRAVDWASPKFGKTYLVQVPGRTQILFHWGNRLKDTTGCILVGRKVGWIEKERAVLESINAFKDFKRALGHISDFTLSVMEIAT